MPMRPHDPKDDPESYQSVCNLSIAPRGRCTRRSLCGGILGLACIGRRRAAAGGQIGVGADRILTFGDVRVPCVVGRHGVATHKTEGDGATPAGRFPLRQVLYRPDRVSSVDTPLPSRALDRNDAWCDDPAASEYNTLVRLPFAKHTEPLWRADRLYDVLIVIGYNDAPVVPGAGSAIFLHVAPPGLKATDGCVAIAMAPLLRVAKRCDTATTIDIAAPGAR
jgi:L,D-peptidoglycan transpeptidase YkuD (ErfK/YbiS/YcfS/YnhG family)